MSNLNNRSSLDFDFAMSPAPTIRPATATDHGRLLDIWLAASRAGHPFLSEARLAADRAKVRDIYLPQADTWLATAAGDPVGFIGLIDHFIGGLFVDPAAHGSGVGRALVTHAAARLGALSVSVYADNGGALAFYRRLGFVETTCGVEEEDGPPLTVVTLAKPAI